MTKEGRENLLLAALAVSVAAHVGLMFAARSVVMTHVDRSALKAVRREAMRADKFVARPDPVSIDVVKDLKAAKDAPVVDASGDATAKPAAPETVATEEPVKEDPAKVSPVETIAPAESPAFFAVEPVGAGDDISRPPEMGIETPELKLVATAPVARLASGSGIQVPAFEAPAVAPPQVAAPAATLPRKDDSSGKEPEFVPKEEVFATVDEKIVEAEKKAVRTLLDAEGVNDASAVVDMKASSVSSDGWTYFKVEFSPKKDLVAVPKDIVILIDASGSIGNDRLASCRAAARRILRSCTNTGDRFNLVAFRNRFQYAFNSWRECDKESFERADKWLSNLAAHGRTDVFASIRSVLTLPRNPKRPLIALVVTDGDANEGVKETADILSRFTALNDGLVSVYMYGVKGSANRKLIDVLTRGNRGESFIFGGMRWNAGSGIESLSERFRDPVMSDFRIVFPSALRAEAYPRLLRNLYRGGTVEIFGRVPAGTTEVSFSLKGLNGSDAYEGFFRLPLASSAKDPSLPDAWEKERALDMLLH